MKILLSVLTLLALSFGAATPAQAAVCKPYAIPIQSTVVACGPGFVGVKYKTSTLNCDTGRITESTAYDTSGCVAANPGAGGGQLVGAKKCTLTPDACAAVPIAQGCPTGQHWTLAGTKTAHCVPDDPICGWGTSLTHDANGFPSCLVNTCSGGKVLQADGISCACPANTVLSNGTCVAAPPSCLAGSVAENAACGGVQLGMMSRTKNTSCPSGPYGTSSIAYTDWNVSGCSMPAVTCTANSSTESASCPNGYSGSKYRSVYTTCPSGAYGSPSVSYSGWTDTCTAPAPVCSQSTNTVAMACGSGFTGTKYITTTNLCPSGTSTSEDASGCGCANGGTNYPICTPPAPPAVVCPPTKRTCGFEQSGVIVMTVFTTTYSAPSCAPTTTQERFYVDDTSCPYDE